MSGLLLAFAAGLVTILNPCILPVLPILIGSAIDRNKFGPLALSAGLVASFTVLGVLVLAAGFSIGLDENAVRLGAAVVMIAAGVVLAVPRAQAAFAGAAAPIAAGGNRLLGRISGERLGGQFALGGLLGLVWTPCVGPTLGAAIAAASRGADLLAAFLTFFVFALGVSLSLLAFAYGSRKALAARKARFQALARWSKPLLGGALVLVGAAIATGIDKALEAAVVDAMPSWLVDFTTRF